MFEAGQRALLAALAAYNAGSLPIGFRNGYVFSILEARAQLERHRLQGARIRIGWRHVDRLSALSDRHHSRRECGGDLT